MSAREYFEAVAEAVSDATAKRWRWQALADLPSPGGAATIGGCGGDPSWRVADAVDRIEAARVEYAQAVADLDAVLFRAEHVVDALPKAAWRAVVTGRYLAAKAPAEVAAQLGTTPKAVERATDRAFDWLDAHMLL